MGRLQITGHEDDFRLSRIENCIWFGITASLTCKAMSMGLIQETFLWRKGDQLMSTLGQITYHGFGKLISIGCPFFPRTIMYIWLYVVSHCPILESYYPKHWCDSCPVDRLIVSTCTNEESFLTANFQTKQTEPGHPDLFFILLSMSNQPIAFWGLEQHCRCLQKMYLWFINDDYINLMCLLFVLQNMDEYFRKRRQQTLYSGELEPEHSPLALTGWLERNTCCFPLHCLLFGSIHRKNFFS